MLDLRRDYPRDAQGPDVKTPSRLYKSLIYRAVSVLPNREKKRIILVILLQVILSILDLIGVALIGLVGTLAISGISSREPIPLAARVLDQLGISESTVQFQVSLLGIAALVVLASKSFFSFWITKRTSFYLSRRGAELAEELITKLVQLPLNRIRKRSLNENLFALTSGVTILMLGAIASSVFIIADFSMLIIIFIGLFYVDPLMAVLSATLFSGVGLALFFAQSKKAHTLGLEKSQLMTYGNQKTLELFQAYREILVRNSRAHYAREISGNRKKLAEIEAEVVVMQFISKYAIEAFFLFVVVFMSAIQFLLRDAIEAVGVLSMFLAASARVSPGVLRIQQNAIGIKNSLAIASITIELFEDIKEDSGFNSKITQSESKHTNLEFLPRIEVADLSFSYPDTGRQILGNINFVINPGEFVALVGPSGSGKSTLFDCCLGVQVPDSGRVLISGLSPQDAYTQFPGAVAFVPQDVFVAATSIRDNLLLGYEDHFRVSDEDIWSALSDVDLTEEVSLLPNGIHGLLADSGSNLSGGQKQRLGIARALLTKPKVLFLDEATSNLDGQTEEKVSSAIKSIRNSASIFMIAHRLSTVASADRIIYLESGGIKATGTFQEVRHSVPDFERQAQLMGL